MRIILGGVLVISAAAILPAVTAHAADNLVSNPSVEVAGTGGQPADWTFNRWGTNAATSAWQAGGHDGQKSLVIVMTSRSSGDAKWMSAPITVKPGTKYAVSDWYLSNVQTSLEAVYTDAAGQQTYAWLADAPASGSWKQASATMTTPATAAKVQLYHVLARKGSLQTDGYALSESGGAPPPTPPAVKVTAPAEGATVAGTEQITATAGTGVAGVRFQVDGVDVGTEDTSAPFAATWDTTKSANGAHTVTAVARTTGAQTSSTSITVTVSNTSAPNPPPPNPPVPPAGGSNLLANPSVETVSGSAPASWANSKWGTNTTAFTYLTSGHTGSRSVKTEISAYSSGDAKWSPTAVSVTAGKTYQYTGWYQSNVDSEVDVEVTMANGTLTYLYLTTASASAAWAKVSGQFTTPTGATKVTVFQVLDKKGWVIGDDFALNAYTPAQLSRGLVSLTFDDGWLDQYTNGVPLLDKYNMDATFYLLTNTVDFDDYMTKAQMGDLAKHGHEIASHTVSHPHLPTLSAAAMDGELKNSQQTLRQWYGSTVAKNFATPYGEYNAAVLAGIKKYYRSHRSTDEGFNTKDDTDVFNVKVQNILNTTTPAQVGAWVDQAVRDKSWLVIVYHEVGTGLADPTYSVTPTNLEAELKLIQSKQIAVRTVDQALDEVVPQL